MAIARAPSITAWSPASERAWVAKSGVWIGVPAGATFVLHDCNQDFDFADESSIDIVFAGEVTEHIFDDRRFLDQILRVLGPATRSP